MVLALTMYGQDNMTLTKLIHDIQTDKVTEIELSAKEVTEIESTQAAQAARAVAEAAKAAQKQALLDRLGITQEEAQLLLGGN